VTTSAARVCVAVAALAVAALVVPAPGVAAVRGDLIASVARPTPATAWKGKVVFSRFERGRYALVLYDGKRTRRLAAPTRSVPFDADVGAGAGGRLTVVYSRCRREPVTRIDRFLPSYIGGDGCDLYAFDVAKGAEARLRGLSRGDALEYSPTIWNGRIAFARVFDRRKGTAGILPHLYVSALSGKGERRLPGPGPRGPISLTGDNQADRDLNGPGPIRLQLRGDVLTYSWAYVAPTNAQPPNAYCPQPPYAGLPEDDFEQRITEIRTLRGGSPSTLEARACRVNVPSSLLGPSRPDGKALIFGAIVEGAGCVESRMTRQVGGQSRTLSLGGFSERNFQAISMEADGTDVYVAATDATDTDIRRFRALPFEIGSPLEPAGAPTCVEPS
jgi:hypothetical protein